MLGLAASSPGAEFPVAWMIGLGLAAVFALYISYKIGRFLMKLVLAVIVLAAIAGAVWWFWLRQ
jgi:hypothetical protein